MFDILSLTGFHRAQIPLHVEIFARHGKKIRGSAVVGASAAARFAAISAALMARMNLKTFDHSHDAMAWFKTIPAASARR